MAPNQGVHVSEDVSERGQREYGQEERFSPTEEDRSILPRRVTGASVPKSATLVHEYVAWVGRRFTVGDDWPKGSREPKSGRPPYSAYIIRYWRGVVSE